MIEIILNILVDMSIKIVSYAWIVRKKQFRFLDIFLDLSNKFLISV